MSFTASSIVRALIVAGAASLLSAQPAGAQSLDGTSFQGLFVAKGKTRGDADTLSFSNGRFRSSACDRFGYSDATYTATSEGGVIRFEAQTESPKYGTLRWTGYVRGDKLDATATMLQDGKAPIENWVVASRKK